MERDGCLCECLKIPGVCFDPSDEELVACYLTEKLQGRPLQCTHLMTELKIYDDDLMPWEVVKDDNPYWMTSSTDSSNKIKKTIYVFTELRRKGSNVIRKSGRGSWKGQNNPVVKDRAGNDIGYNKLLTFYQDNKGKKKTDNDHGHWLMHEYSLFGVDNYVLCKIIKEVKISAKASILCPIDAAATTQELPVHQATNVDDQADNNMEGREPTLDDFLNFVLAWDGSDKNCKEVRINQKASTTDAAATTQELPDIVCGKNGLTDEACAVDYSCCGVEDQAADNNMEGSKQILDDDFLDGLDDVISVFRSTYGPASMHFSDKRR